MWFINQNVRNINYLNETKEKNLTDNIIEENFNLFEKQLSVLVTMTQIMRSIYNKSNNTTFDSEFDLLYLVSGRTNLFFQYPITTDDDDLLMFVKKFKNPTWCKNESLAIPEYFYFSCRPWFVQTKEFTKNNTDSIVITNRYVYTTSEFAFSICSKFNDTLDITKDRDNSLIMCLDIKLNDYYNLLDNFNSQLSGYLIVVKVESNFPLYYPMDETHNYVATLERSEFNYNTIFFISELLEFE